MPDSGSVICIGTDLHPCGSRRLVLQLAGLDVTWLPPSAALAALPGSQFDIMIVSMNVSEEDRAALAVAAPSRTRILELNGFVSPPELLHLVRSSG